MTDPHPAVGLNAWLGRTLSHGEALCKPGRAKQAAATGQAARMPTTGRLGPVAFAVAIRQPQTAPADWLAVASAHSTAEPAEAQKNNRPANGPKQL
jgi:hypothetical protein